MDREQHLAWCKHRALEYVELGDLAGAFQSMVSDLSKHPDTALKNKTIQALLMTLGMRAIGDRCAMTEWINGFN